MALIITGIICFAVSCLIVTGSIKIYARFRDNVTKAFLADILKRSPTPDEVARTELETEQMMTQIPGLFPYHGGGSIL
ncbi:hypothetical protein COT44_02065 [Candidatus Shapirobacteria bacterium CG08_land_8_20_14_0_20_39_18]|uniref:Uncharacterized protein n=1 Tax=Candidatus Shapirobacteria bacterium CG08_land_8_20_14_0_20_39_18 TaxID=1974883 RepID=A0A2M6XD96_9BACT|nr:MAG: hypothetical protein COT44_02065 [Candidatus Shapirobacteria bacterium CG08_land_8_20_14_0_20_39_18]PIY66026.1 MAG: hypothetical protein COY91_00965 [Candidatus Shapirobacteria bacterium CG_4_10_14_0_8_um_filter_39_15]PJE68173.1 MAG: hypothetical protein COU94_03220 [Candidatus Shapirobacteria bacterium CG10_big_fil_rev_8_21_14_0_10_38_8]